MISNGTPASAIPDVHWVKSSKSYDKHWHDCVELAALPGGDVAMRNSRDPNGPALVFTPSELAAFLGGAKDGEFDHLV